MIVTTETLVIFGRNIFSSVSSEKDLINLDDKLALIMVLLFMQSHVYNNTRNYSFYNV